MVRYGGTEARASQQPTMKTLPYLREQPATRCVMSRLAMSTMLPRRGIGVGPGGGVGGRDHGGIRAWCTQRGLALGTYAASQYD